MNTGYLQRIPKLKYKMELWIWNEVSDIFPYYFLSCDKYQKITKLPTRENFEPPKYLREKTWDPQNTHKKKFKTHIIPTKENRHPQNIQQKKLSTHEIPTRKNLGPTKYPREKIDDPRTTHKGMIARWYETHDGMRRSKFSTLNYGEVCQKHYGKALRYTLEGVGILSEQGKWKNDRC